MGAQDVLGAWAVPGTAAASLAPPSLCFSWDLQTQNKTGEALRSEKWINYCEISCFQPASGLPCAAGCAAVPPCPARQGGRRKELEMKKQMPGL